MSRSALIAASVLACTALLPAARAAEPAPLSVPLHIATAEGQGEAVGTVTLRQTRYGLEFTPQLRGLPPGLHGFHLHANPSCDPAVKDGKPSAAEAAGGHLDPKKTGRHGLPWGDGHLGDLPPLFVAADGTATQPVLAPRLKLASARGHALMVHAGGDNHADHPQMLGGGGARMACGVVPE